MARLPSPKSADSKAGPPPEALPPRMRRAPIEARNVGFDLDDQRADVPRVRIRARIESLMPSSDWADLFVEVVLAERSRRAIPDLWDPPKIENGAVVFFTSIKPEDQDGCIQQIDRAIDEANRDYYNDQPPTLPDGPLTEARSALLRQVVERLVGR